MLILISPAKIMKDERIHKPTQPPIFVKKAQELTKEIRQLDVEQLMKLMKINDKIADITVKRFSNMKYDVHGYSALDCYDGLQFKSMHLTGCDDQVWAYLDEHLRILSGFYGVLRPSDAIYPYRLEMQTKLDVDGIPHLYAYWMDDIAKELMKQRMHHVQPFILNLASKEYDKCIRPYIMDETFIDIEFYERSNQKLNMHSTQAKTARGNMVRFLADHTIELLEDVKSFDVDGYHFNEQLSDATHFIFVKDK